MKQPVATLFGVAIAIVLAGAPAHAQERPERPYRGLFGGGGSGGGSGSSDAEQSLTATASVGGGFDTSVLADARDAGFGSGSTNPAQSQEGGYLLLSEGLTYSLNKRTLSLTAQGSASARYYPTLENKLINNYGGGAGVSWAPSTRNRIIANQFFTYQPFNLYSLFPVFETSPLGQVDLAGLDYGTVDAGYYTSTTDLQASRDLSARSTLSADYSYTRSDFSLGYPDHSRKTAGARFSRNITSGLGLRLGYSYTSVDAGEGRTVGMHGIDSGIDYSKTLSFSRRTSLAFSTGGAATTYREETYITAIGSATLNHEIGRTWTFIAAYNRNVGFVETFAATPFAYDSATVTLSGLLDRQWSFHAAGGAALGNLGFNTVSGSAFDTYYATTGVARALSRHLSLTVDYSFYRYNFDETTVLPRGYNQDFNRNSVRAALSAWIPLVQRGRRSNAAR